MGKFLKQNILLVSVFITGACVLIIEVVAVRILSPYYGNTIFTVSSVISVILAALSAGYYVGGKLADKYPSPKWFFRIILASGIVVIGTHFLGIITLPSLSVNFSLAAGPLLFSVFLFFSPAFLLGMLSPYAIKLSSIQSPEQGIGNISGKIFFWSTLGSIAGSLSAGFILIPRFGISYIFIVTGFILFFLGFIPLVAAGNGRKRLITVFFAVIALTIAAFFATQQAKSNILYSKDGVYEKIIIYDGAFKNRPVRFFQQDRSSSGAMFLDSDDPSDLVYEYSKYYSLYEIFKPEVKNILVIGGGAYSIPKAFLSKLPDTTVDVSEIEPSLFELAKKYFKAEDNPNLRNYTEDGRRLLQVSDKKYDLIFGDAYQSIYFVPAHLATQEFFSIVKNSLSENGLFIANFIGNLAEQRPSFIFSEMKTFRNVFPNSYFFAVDSPEKTAPQNIIFAGYNSDKKIDLNADLVLQNKNPIIGSLRDKIINPDNFDLSFYPILVDDFAPVEYLTAKVLRQSY